MKKNDNLQAKIKELAPQISAVAFVAAAALLLPAVSHAGAILPVVASIKIKVPEPSLLLMLGTGISGLGLLRWRLKK